MFGKPNRPGGRAAAAGASFKLNTRPNPAKSKQFCWHFFVFFRFSSFFVVVVVVVFQIKYHVASTRAIWMEHEPKIKNNQPFFLFFVFGIILIGCLNKATNCKCASIARWFRQARNCRFIFMEFLQ